MFKPVLTAVALSGLVLVAACSSQNEATATAPVAAAPAVASQAPIVLPDPPQPVFVIPPKPKPGEPHGPGFDMPLIELAGYSPPRPMDVLKDAHVFTADHPEVSSYIPCYCGCGAMGHNNNSDCFVKQRDQSGRVTEWEPHGIACAVCIDIAVQSMRMHNSGASVTAIRSQVQSEYRQHFPDSETMTAAPPPKP